MSKHSVNYTVYVHSLVDDKGMSKYYVGITCQKPEKRWGVKGNGYKTQLFYRAIQKYGWDNIQHEIVASNLTKEEAENFEIILIKQLQSNNRKYGYNVDNGGNGTDKLSEETKRKIGKANSGRCGEKHHFYGKNHNNEAKRKMSESKKGMYAGKKHPMYGKRGKDTPMYGKTMSEEAKRKISEAKGCKVICNGTMYDSIGKFAIDNELNRVTANMWLNGKRCGSKRAQYYINELGLRYATEEEIEEYKNKLSNAS